MYQIFRRIALIFGLFALAACEEGAIFAPAAPSGQTQSTSSGNDIERSDVFSVTEQALWDGRPTLGGVWASHPDVDDPERIRITNEANGKSVIGALFRDERDLPGPALKISSDAAAALGIQAGTPVTLNVVAIRREMAEEASAESAPETATSETSASSDEPGLSEIVEASIGETPAPTGPAEPAATGPAPSRPYVQVGVFSVLDNAEGLVAILDKNGVKAQIQEVERSGSAVYRVVAGPAATRADVNALLKQIKELGFPDAFLTR